MPLGKQICFTIVWGCAEILPKWVRKVDGVGVLLLMWFFRFIFKNSFEIPKIIMKAMLKSLEIPPNVSLGSTLLWSYLLVMVWGLMACNFLRWHSLSTCASRPKKISIEIQEFLFSEGFWNDSDNVNPSQK